MLELMGDFLLPQKKPLGMPSGPKVSVSYRLPRALVDRLKAQSERTGWSLTDIVVRYLWAACDEAEKALEPKKGGRK